ncbi:hypothetical protein O181_056073 [Austropuccinia psidii MF-1]|uniref:CCHC-type domain-containing protein n=1 Tax=Austropuccinia psidii MF-1 TaxID=1389203 RepID=A0A9Q3ECF6_9BASI|nr:hypothetical protein [Austropuccinia psidii MF-1]
MIGTPIGRYNSHIIGDNSKNPTLEAKEAFDSEDEITKACHNCGSPNHYADTCPKAREEIFPREDETRKDQEGSESYSNSVRNGCGDASYS